MPSKNAIVVTFQLHVSNSNKFLPFKFKLLAFYRFLSTSRKLAWTKRKPYYNHYITLPLTTEIFVLPHLCAASCRVCLYSSQNTVLSRPAAWLAISLVRGSHSNLKFMWRAPIKYLRGTCNVNDRNYQWSITWFLYIHKVGYGLWCVYVENEGFHFHTLSNEIKQVHFNHKQNYCNITEYRISIYNKLWITVCLSQSIFLHFSHFIQIFI